MPPPGVCLNIVHERHKKAGQGSPSNPQRFLDQDYHRLHQYCLVNNRIYIDEMFPPDRRSIGQGLLSSDILARIVWLRPKQMVPDPYFVNQGLSRFDVAQGALGNCWFLASIGALTFQKHLIEQILLSGQSFQDGYAGIFHFRFWRFGEWVDVVVDDLLPTIDGGLIFVKSKSPNEFWAALLEKAYAKVCGSYADMHAGTASEALMDFTGGVHMTFKLSEVGPELWDLMYKAGKSKSLMVCSTPGEATSTNQVLPNGLVEGHVYTISGVTLMVSDGKPVTLVRLYNPWGRGEWNGDWSDQSSKWKMVSVKDRTECLSIGDDGEFWMSMEDFCKYYSNMDICWTSPDLIDGSTTFHWTTESHEGRWVAGTTAGGCLNHSSFWANPQYRFELTDVTLGQGPNMLVSLMQKSDKRHRSLISHHHIGFSIFELPAQLKGKTGKLPASFFKCNHPVAQTKQFLNAREVMESFSLKPGYYITVPATFKPNQSASFILTIHSKTGTHIEENANDQMEIRKFQPIPTDKGEVKYQEFPLFLQYCDQYKEVDADQLQKLLNENLLEGVSGSKQGGFGLDSCRSIVAVMDLSVTGRLNEEEFIRLWERAVKYRDIFFLTDASRTGTLSLTELRNAVELAGIYVSDRMLNLMILRYGGSTGQITLENFICFILRMDCMAQTFRTLAKGSEVHLGEREWMYLSMYT